MEELRRTKAQLEVEVEKLRFVKAELESNIDMCIDNIDYEAARDRVLSEWRTSKRAESRERIKEALNKFIRHLRSPVTYLDSIVQPQDPPVSKKGEPETNTAWESRVESFLGGVSWNG